jgi:hypothetical protein
MKREFSILFVCFVVFSAAVSQFADSSTAAYRSSQDASAIRPVILYAQWIGKNLDVEGANFGDGATVLVDGQRLKTVNADNFPSSFLFAKKAKKKVPRNQAITLQVQNPDGETSDPFPFYSGFLLTMDDSGTVLHLNVGDRFLLFLPPHGEPATVGWGVGIGGLDPTAMKLSTNDLPIPRAQGFFEAVHPGQFTISAEAGPLCPPLPPEQCAPRGANFDRFDLVVVVE